MWGVIPNLTLGWIMNMTGHWAGGATPLPSGGRGSLGRSPHSSRPSLLTLMPVNHKLCGENCSYVRLLPVMTLDNVDYTQHELISEYSAAHHHLYICLSPQDSCMMGCDLWVLGAVSVYYRPRVSLSRCCHNPHTSPPLPLGACDPVCPVACWVYK